MDTQKSFDVVTGAFSYSGSAIAMELQRRGRDVRTLTGHPDRASSGTDIEAYPLDFTNRGHLAESMEGAHTLFNTYWVRFAHGKVDHDVAVANSQVLFEAAARAGIERIVHVSILHPSLDSAYPYFRGKARVEESLTRSGIPHAVVRPAVLFGNGGVLVNNIAWLLRHLPVFAVGGRGDYQVRGIHVEDLARLCVDLGERRDTVVLDAVGPDRLTFRELVETIRRAVGSRSRIVSVPGPVLLALSTVLGVAVRDRVLTAEEYHTMAAGMADSDAEATGEISFAEWVAEHADELGRHYANELRRHFVPPTGPAHEVKRV